VRLDFLRLAGKLPFLFTVQYVTATQIHLPVFGLDMSQNMLNSNVQILEWMQNLIQIVGMRLDISLESRRMGALNNTSSPWT
jgi:hypothetical protein